MVRDAYKFILPLLILGGVTAFLHIPPLTILIVFSAAFVAIFSQSDRCIPTGNV
jgi:hypothetical protein